MRGVALPPVEVEGPGGIPVVVAARSPDDTVGELAAALGVDPEATVVIDGQAVPRATALVAVGFRRGSRVGAALGDIAPSSTASRPLVIVVCEAGPGATGPVRLGAGRHVIGRAAPVAVRIDDPAVEPHHGVLDVTVDGAVHFTQLTGRVPCRVDGDVVAAGVAHVVRDGGAITIGASRIRIGRAGELDPVTLALAPTPGDPWRWTVRRPPRRHVAWGPPPIVVADVERDRPAHSSSGVLAALLAAVGALVVAVVMTQPMFLLFAAAGLFASLGTWVVGAVGDRRRRRRNATARRDRRLAIAAAFDDQRQARWRHHLLTTPTVAEAIAAVEARRADLWQRRSGHDDAFQVTLGWGPVRWSPVVDGASASTDGRPDPDIDAALGGAELFDDAPVPTDIGPGAALAVAGPGAAGVARSMLIQLATWTGPADWRLVVVVDDPRSWAWCRWLPQAAGAGGSANVVGADQADAVAAALLALDDGDERHVVVVTDRPDLLATRTGALRRFLAGRRGALVAVVPEGDTVPAMCASVLEIGSIGVARWWPATAERGDAVHVAGIGPSVAADVAMVLAGLLDPEDPSASAASLPGAVGLSGLCEQFGPGALDDAIAVAGAWRSAGADPPPSAVLGVTADGVVEIDLARDGPHALVAGTTGSGKSELLRTLVVALAARHSPDHLTFVLVDYKGGATFDACADLPHTVGVVTDLDDRSAERALVSLDAEVRRRERTLRAVGAADLGDYRSVPGRPALPRLAVVIDEFAALAAELPSFLGALVGVAQRGRSLGLHLVLATQRPAGVVSDDIRANTNLRIALRLQDPADATDVIGDTGPARFSRGTPGRAMVRLGPDETVTFQSARSTGPFDRCRDDRLRVVASDERTGAAAPTELAILVDSIRHAAALSDVAAPHRPWLPALPEVLTTAVPAGAVGIVDVPDEQRRTPLRWRPEDGNLAIVGACGSGTTTAVCSVLAALCADRSSDDVHVYVVDARGDERLAAAEELAHCGAVVRPHERERLGRLLRSLVDDLDARRSGAVTRVRPLVLVVDGLPALRTVLDGPHDSADDEGLRRVLAEGPAVGIVSLLTAERPGALSPSILAGCAERWVLHLDDPQEAPACGVPAALVPGDIPGRLVVASTGREAQLAALELGGRAERPERPVGAPPIGTLPELVDASTLPAGRAVDGDTALVVGIEFQGLGPAVLDVPDGEHVMIVGPPRSGRSGALVRLARSWRQAHPDGAVVVVCPVRRSAVVPWADAEPGVAVVAATDVAGIVAGGPGHGWLLVVDDAERVMDDDGTFAALVGERRPSLLVVAAGRPDALRTLYGHWTAVVRRSRLGLLMSSCADTDGDLLGELLPRSPPLRPRPGLAWLVGAGRRELVQVGLDADVPARNAR